MPNPSNLQISSSSSKSKGGKAGKNSGKNKHPLSFDSRFAHLESRLASIESRLAYAVAEGAIKTAEKDVAIALDTFDYDDVITLASNALKPGPKNKNIIKARKNMLWSRSHAYHFKGKTDLALNDAKAALQLNPNDPIAHIRVASLFNNTEPQHRAQAESYLVKATKLAERRDPTERASLLSKIDRQRERLSKDRVPRVPLDNDLPNEVLALIAMHLDPAGRAAMMRTCKRWRETLIASPCVWKTLAITRRPRSLEDAPVKRWLEYISLHARRSNDALESVTFDSPFPEKLLRQVLRILLPSAPTLVHVQIPTMQQRICYESLYCCCPRLKSLVLPESGDRLQGWNLIPSTLHDMILTKAAKTTDAPFSLRKLKVTGYHRKHVIDLHAHLLDLRVLQGCNPWELVSDIKMTSTQYVQFYANLGNSLEEWVSTYEYSAKHPRMIDGGQSFALPLTTTFSKLVKLDHFRVQPSLRFTFPQLLEAAIMSFTDEGSARAQELARIIRTSPLLRKLQLCISGDNQPDKIVQEALRGLSNLEDLNLLAGVNDDNYVSGLLAPAIIESPIGAFIVELPFPKLRRLTLGGPCRDIEKLTAALIVRDCLRKGETLLIARRMAAETLTSLKEGTPTSSTASSVEVPAPGDQESSTRKQNGPALMPEKIALCCRLEVLELRRIHELPAYLEPALRSIGVDLVYSYDHNSLSC